MKTSSFLAFLCAAGLALATPLSKEEEEAKNINFDEEIEISGDAELELAEEELNADNAPATSLVSQAPSVTAAIAEATASGAVLPTATLAEETAVAGDPTLAEAEPEETAVTETEAEVEEGDDDEDEDEEVVEQEVDAEEEEGEGEGEAEEEAEADPAVEKRRFLMRWPHIRIRVPRRIRFFRYFQHPRIPLRGSIRIVMRRNGMVRFATKITNTSFWQRLHYAVSCGVRDGGHSAYTLTRQGRVTGKFVPGKTTDAVDQTRYSYAVRKNWWYLVRRHRLVCKIRARRWPFPWWLLNQLTNSVVARLSMLFGRVWRTYKIF